MAGTALRITRFVTAAAMLAALAAHSQTRSLEQGFASPPDDARLMMRWWWFGPAVTQAELGREMEQMQAAGIGGFEIQPVYPVALDQSTGEPLRNLPYLSGAFLEDLRYVNLRAQALGLRVSLTLSSGWPYGGPHTPVDQAAGALRIVRADVPAGVTSTPVPALEHGEALIAAFLDSPGISAAPDAYTMLPLPSSAAARTNFPASPQPRTLLWFVSSRTGQQVKRAALGAEGYVLDHFSRAAIDEHLRDVADPLLSAFSDKPPYSVFSDSLEVYGSDWTPDLAAEFKRRRGYDFLPHLPQLLTGNDDASLSVRHDWGQTLTELVEENYLQPIESWATAHHTLFRSQTYGDPAVALSSNALVDLPEGEGPQWKQFSYTRWATSASHLYGRDVTSAEAFTWLHSPAFRATPLDIKAEADRFFLEGVNQFMGHGWPYSPPSAGEPGWRFYAAGAFNTHNPWWFAMPEIARYLQRISWILRQGKPANDIAVYLPEDDAYAAFTPGKVSLSDRMPRWITPELTAAIEDAGYGFDYIDSRAIAARGIEYPVLLLPGVDRIAPATLERIAQYQRRGGKVIALARLPAHGAGLQDFVRDSDQVQAAAQALVSVPAAGRLVLSTAELPQALHALLPPDLELAHPAPELGFLHRSLPDADVYFLANTGNHAIHTSARFRSRRQASEWLEADTGLARAATSTDGHPGEFAVDLEPYASRILLISGPAGAHPLPPEPQMREALLADLSHGWRVTFNANGSTETKPSTIAMANLASWTEMGTDRGTGAGADASGTTGSPALLYYSGTVTYRKSFAVSKNPDTGARTILSFGSGTPIADTSAHPNHPGMRALFDPPIREAAEVCLNGKRVGTLWHPPYELNITEWVRPGANELEITVGNTAINELAGQSPATYRLLDDRYGDRFTPQDMEGVKPLPSGLLGPVRLLTRTP